MTHTELEKEVKKLRQIITEIQVTLNTNCIKRKPGYITGTEYAERYERVWMGDQWKLKEK